MAKDPQILDFTLPARDFGHLYTTLNTLESQFAGVTVAALERLACWHVIDRCRMACCRCGIPVKWLLQEPETPEAKSNAALLLRLRQFFAALGPDDQPDEYWTSGEKPDPVESMHVRVILRPIAQLEVKKPAALPLEYKPETPEELGRSLAASRRLTYPNSPDYKQPLVAGGKYFGETSRPDLYPPFEAAPAVELESGCMCANIARQATSIMELAGLAGSVHPLCPIHGVEAQNARDKRLTDEQLAARIAGMTDRMAEAFPEEAAAAGYIPEGKGTVDGQVIDPVSVQRALKAGEFVQQLGGQIIEIDEAPGADYTAIVEWKPTHIADTCPKCLCPKAICVCKPAGYLLSCPDIPMISVTEAEKRAMDAIIDAAVDPNATEADLAKAFDEADRIVAELAQPPVDPRVGQLIEQARATAQRLDGDQSSPLFATDARALEAAMCGIPAPSQPQPEQFCRGCVKPLSNCDCGSLPDAPTADELYAELPDPKPVFWPAPGDT